MIRRDGPFDFMIDLGDSPQPIATNSAQDALERYLQYRDVMAPVHRQMPAYLVLGNHEKEAGFHQRGADDSESLPLWNRQTASQYHQKWAAEARLRCIPNPRGDTYPEGGEGAPGYDSLDDWLGVEGPWNDNTTREHLQNFYAWTWGDALFIVLDPFRYTLVGSVYRPNRVSDWTLGPTQMQWLEDVLAGSNASWKFVMAHHLVGGGAINRRGQSVEEGGNDAVYARGSAVEAGRSDSEQALVHTLMRQHGVQFFLYGHDHAFCHGVLDEVNYICCGRPTHLSRWWCNDGMLDSYGSIIDHGQGKPWIRELYNTLGYTSFSVTPNRVTMRWIRTGYSCKNQMLPINEASRDWRECWAGLPYPVDSPQAVTVNMPAKDVRGVRTVSGARITDFFIPPPGDDYYVPPGPLRSNSTSPATIVLYNFPQSIAVVETVPELLYELTIEM